MDMFDKLSLAILVWGLATGFVGICLEDMKIFKRIIPLLFIGTLIWVVT